jgi:ankyrin repeat protein
MNDINITLFKLLKNHEWDKFKQFIENTPDIDLNIRDNSQNYLIQYAIMYNKHDIVNYLVDKGCKIDIYDIDGQNILYNPIKYNYTNVINYILDYEKKNIGISIRDMKDNDGFNPIHYAVLFKNIDALDLFIKYKYSFDDTDSENNIPLHLAVKTKNIDIFKKVIEQTQDINFQTKQGESALHIACNFDQKDMIKMLIDKKANINIQDCNTQIIPLMYTILSNDYEIFDILLEGTDLELQDINGNNSLHYCIIEKNYEFIDKIVNKNLDLDITNIYGKTILHIILENFSSSVDIMHKFNLNKIVQNTNLNIQDNNGTSCFLLICKTGIWKKIIPILENKRINIEIKNKDNETILEFINSENIDIFYDMVAKSYINTIRQDKFNLLSFNNEILTVCKKELNFKKYDQIKDIINIPTLENMLKKTDKDICFDVIKLLIIEKKLFYPRTLKNYCIDLTEFSENINFITYTGTPLDILFGLIYLQSLYDNILTTLSSDFIENSALEQYYLKEKSRTLKKQDFINFEIIWDGQNIFYPTILDKLINKFKNNKKFQYLVIPIGIELENGSHSNILLYDKIKNEIERFEPNGGSYPYKFNYNPEILNGHIESKFFEIFPNCIYKTPVDYLPKIGFQLLESYDHYKTKKIGDPGGFCAVWCVWYINMRIKYNVLSREHLIIKLIQKIKEENIPFKTLIRNYAKRIIDIRDEILVESNIDINEWLNADYEQAIYDNFIINIQKKVVNIINVSE